MFSNRRDGHQLISSIAAHPLADDGKPKDNLSGVRDLTARVQGATSTHTPYHSPHQPSSASVWPDSHHLSFPGSELVIQASISFCKICKDTTRTDMEVGQTNQRRRETSDDCCRLYSGPWASAKQSATASLRHHEPIEWLPSKQRTQMKNMRRRCWSWISHMVPSRRNQAAAEQLQGSRGRRRRECLGDDSVAEENLTHVIPPRS